MIQKETLHKALCLYLITDSKRSILPLRESVEDALRGGVTAVQIREKNPKSTLEFYNLASDLRKLTKKYNALLIINDRIDIMLAVGADGIHLGWQSLPINDARKIIGNNKIIGISTHSCEEAIAAANAGADYITLSPIFQTESKQNAIPIGISEIEKTRISINIPLIALGGIKRDNIESVIKAGATGAAMIGELLSTKEPKKVAEELLFITKSF